MYVTFDRPFGVEVEFVGVTGEAVVEALSRRGFPALHHRYVPRPGYAAPIFQESSFYRDHVWRTMPEGSIMLPSTGEMATELVTPILHGVAGMYQLGVALDVLHELGAIAAPCCDTHVHFDIADYQMAHFRRLIRTYAQAQPLIDLMLPTAWKADALYVHSLHPTDLAALDEFNDITEWAAGRERRVGVNAHAVAAHGTIEFRQFPVCFDVQAVTAWINFCGALVADGLRTNAPPLVEEGMELTDVLDRLPLMPWDRNALLWQPAKARAYDEALDVARFLDAGEIERYHAASATKRPSRAPVTAGNPYSIPFVS